MIPLRYTERRIGRDANLRLENRVLHDYLLTLLAGAFDLAGYLDSESGASLVTAQGLLSSPDFSARKTVIAGYAALSNNERKLRNP